MTLMSSSEVSVTFTVVCSNVAYMIPFDEFFILTHCKPGVFYAACGNTLFLHRNIQYLGTLLIVISNLFILSK